jgi:thiamine-phosphate pyrophosphorylase
LIESSPYRIAQALPRLYPILDASGLSDASRMCEFAEQLAAAGCTLLQYRNKESSARQMLDDALELKARLGPSVRLVMNDRADLCLAAAFDGLHVGQDRRLGVSTHNPEQLAEADQSTADYLALGPVFATSSKANPDPVVGLEGVRRARGLTRKPLVAIGGITRANARSVLEAGADSVAVISDLLRDPRKSAEEFLRILG